MDKSTPFTHPPDGWFERTRIAELEAENKCLKAELFTMRNVFHQQDAEIELLRAVLDGVRRVAPGTVSFVESALEGEK